jgi:hypothetical protein
MVMDSAIDGASKVYKENAWSNVECVLARAGGSFQFAVACRLRNLGFTFGKSPGRAEQGRAENRESKSLSLMRLLYTTLYTLSLAE